MNKKKQITLAIPQPCTQDWEGMSVNEQGRHCASCNKTVIDFTNYTDRELVEFFKKTKGEVCGNLESYQLDRVLPIYGTNSNSFIHKALFSSALIAGIANGLSGQTINSNPTRMSASAINKSENENKILTKLSTGNSSVYIRGTTLHASSNIPVPGITISIKGTNYTCTSDSVGAFSIQIPDNLQGKKITLLTHKLRYLKKSKTVIEAGSYPGDLKIMLPPRHPLFHPVRRGRVCVY